MSALRQKLPLLKGRILPVNIYRDTQESTARIDGGMNPACAELIRYSSSTKVPMLITLVAVLCNGQLMPGESRYH
jgi:hypothetical protein